MSDQLSIEGPAAPSNASQEHERVIRSWFAKLAQLTTPAEPEKCAASFVPLHQFFLPLPGWQFTRRSLTATAGKCGKFPGFAQIHRALEAWAKENAPKPASSASAGALTFDDDTDGLPLETRSWVQSYRQRVRDMTRTDEQNRGFMQIMDRLCPAAALFLTEGRSSPDVSSLDRSIDLRRSWEDVGRVRASVADLRAHDWRPLAMVRLLHTSLARWAPDNLCILEGQAPPDVLEEVLRAADERKSKRGANKILATEALRGLT